MRSLVFLFAALASAADFPSIPIRFPDGGVVSAELALTPKDQQKGLMFRTSMADDRGMLFVFPEETELTFWMKNTFIDLDMVFVGADRRITKVHHRVPRSYPDTPEDRLAVRRARGRFVLELAAGVAERRGLRSGQKLEFKLPKLPPQAPNMRAAEEEALKHLLKLLPIDTRNPPGRETPAARYLAQVLKQAGIPSELLAAKPGRANVVARLKGTGEKRPVLLVSHLDTVGFEREKWTVDPLKGVVKDGYVYGRGAVDNKGLAAVELTALLWLKRNKLRLKRDVILAAVADEESGGRAGARWLLANHRSKLDAEYALNEGGASTLEAGRVKIIGVQAAEKAYYDLKLTARGAGGHGSAPRPDNPIFTLAESLAVLKDWRPPHRLNPVTRAFFAGVRPVEDAPTGAAIDDLLSDDAARAARGVEALSENPRYNAMLRDTLAATMIAGGFRANVVPSEASAVLNCRLLPDSSLETLIETLKPLVGPRVEISIVDRPPDDPPPLMPADSEMFAAFRIVGEELAPGAVVVPYMSTGATDSEYLRRAGILAYGFDFPLDPSDHARMHGEDERVATGALGWGVVFLYRLLEELGK